MDFGKGIGEYFVSDSQNSRKQWKQYKAILSLYMIQYIFFVEKSLSESARGIWTASEDNDDEIGRLSPISHPEQLESGTDGGRRGVRTNGGAVLRKWA